MATFHSGQGGSVVHDPDGTPTTLEGIRTWTLNLTGDFVETTSADTGSVKRWKKTFESGDWTLDLVFDSTNLPNTDLSISMGDTVSLKFNIGDSTTFYQFNSLVESLKVTCAARDAVMYSMGGKVHGTVAHPYTS